MPSSPPKVRPLSDYRGPARSETHNPPEQPRHVVRSAAAGAAEGSVAGPEGAAVGAARGAAKASTARKSSNGGSSRGMTLGSRHLLIAEFLVCFIVLALSPVVGDVSAGTWMKKGTATAMLFVALSLIGETGPRTKNAVTALGGLITLTVLVTHRDIFTMISGKFGGQSKSAADAGAQSAAQGGAPVNINTPEGQQSVSVVPQPGGGFIAGNSADF